MRKAVLLIFFFLVVVFSYGQVTDPMRKVDSVNKKMDSLFRPNKTYDNPTTFDGCLRRDFPESSSIDGRWVYYPAQANIQKIIKPEVSKIIPAYSFYRVVLTNFLGYHINGSGCLILYDSARQRTELTEPLWFSDDNEALLRKFIGVKFKDSISLMQFVGELQDLLLVGTGGSFFDTKYQKDKITYALTFEHVSTSPGITSVVRADIWRTYEITLKDDTIIKFSSTNPKMNETRTVQ